MCEFHLNKKIRGIEIVQRVGALVTKCNDLNRILRLHMVEEENQMSQVLWRLRAHHGMRKSTCPQ